MFNIYKKFVDFDVFQHWNFHKNNL